MEEAIKKAIEDFEWAIHADNRSDISLMDMRMAISALREQPVVHGRWKFGKNHGEFVETECTACGSLLLVKWIDELSNYRYCPNCGARMDGDSIDK